MRYKLTSRGKWFIRIVLVMLASGMFYFGTQLIQYFEIVSSVEESEVSVASNSVLVENQPQTQNHEEEKSENPLKSEEKYTPYQLEDFKTFKMDFDFEEGVKILTSDQLKELNYLLEVLKQYPKEPITIEINNPESDMANEISNYLVAGNFDASQIEVTLRESASVIDTEKTLISIYLTNHYKLAKNSK